jgi:hypothetical protein
MKKKHTKLSLQAIPLFRFTPDNGRKGAPSTDPTLTTITLTTGTEPALPVVGRRSGHKMEERTPLDVQLV